MNSMEQYADIDYYAVLGVTKNCTVQEICSQYTIFHPAIVISPSIVILPSSIRIPIKHISCSLRLLKPLMCSLIVHDVLCS